MKKLIGLFFLEIFITHAGATTYYFSSTDGDDSRTSIQAQNSATPWKTIDKLNSFFSGLQPGDAVLFKRGDIFYGSINVSKSGSSGSPITFGDFGSGDKPVISGLTDVTGWTSIGANLWESASISAGQSTAMIVTINGISYPMGKWPNGTSSSGWRKYSSNSGNSSITDASAAPPFTAVGATVVIRKNQYTIQTGTVILISGNTISYSAASGQTVSPTANYGYFIQNALGTLDAQNEWYYNSSTKKLNIFSTSTPKNVKLANVQSVIVLTNRSFISFNNLKIQGSISDLVTANGSSNIAFTNCTLDAAGNCGIWANTCTNLTFQNGAISNSNNFGIFIAGQTRSSGNVISGSTIINSGINPGMAEQGSHTIIESMCGILAFGGVTIKNNNIINSGYSAIYFKGSNVLIKNNLVDTAMFIKDEGGAVYSYVGASDNTSYTNQVVDGNIVMNSLGALAGKSSTSKVGIGIYGDINIKGLQIINNTVAHISSYGILMQDNQNDIVRNNTVYDCGSSSIAMWTSNSGAVPTRNITITDNICVWRQQNSNLGNLCYQTTEASVTAFGTSDNNIIACPINDVNAWFTASNGSTYNHYTLAQWLSATGKDARSKKSPKTISDVKDLRFEYNASISSKTIILDANYIDLTGKVYTGSITLGPYNSAVLITTKKKPTTINKTVKWILIIPGILIAVLIVGKLIADKKIK